MYFVKETKKGSQTSAQKEVPIKVQTLCMVLVTKLQQSGVILLIAWLFRNFYC